MLPVLGSETQRISSVVTEFLKYHQALNHSVRTIEFYRDKLKRFVLYSDNRQVYVMADITSSLVREYIIEIQNEIKSSGAIHTEGGVHAFFRAVRALTNWYVSEYEPQGWTNPFTVKVKAPHVSEMLLEPVSEEVVNALLAICIDSDYPARNKAIVLFLLATGGRASEVIAVDRNDLDLNGCSAIVRHGKGGYYRFIFFDQRTRTALRNYLKTRTDDLKPLWLNRYNRRLKYGGLREIILGLSERAGIEAPTLHSFRRAYAVDKLMANVPDMTIVQLMGQHSINALRPYTKLSKDLLQKAYNNAVNNK